MKTLPLHASILAVLCVAPSVRTLRLRQPLKIGIGDAGNSQMLRAMRGHSNFAEYVPLCLILLYFVEVHGAAPLLAHALALCLVTGRLSHAGGVRQTKKNFNYRIAAMAMTLTVLLNSSVFLLLGQVRSSWL